MSFSYISLFHFLIHLSLLSMVFIMKVRALRLIYNLLLYILILIWYILFYCRLLFSLLFISCSMELSQCILFGQICMILLHLMILHSLIRFILLGTQQVLQKSSLDLLLDQYLYFIFYHFNNMFLNNWSYL